MTQNNGRHWFVAFVKSCQERRVAEDLGKLGVEHYLPQQREVHKWSDRRKVVVRLLLPRMIFVRVDDLTRRKLLSDVFGMYAYMVDRTTRRPAIVRDAEMEAFRMMVEHSDAPVRMNSEPLAKGDRVRVLSGPLKDMEYELADVQGKHCIVSRLDFLGSAIVEFSIDNLEKIQ